MQKFIIPALLGAGFLLSGCETAVYQQDRHSHGYGYNERGPSVHVDSGYSYGEGRSDDDRHRDEGGYRSQNVDQTRVINNTVNETNVTQTSSNRTYSHQNETNAPRQGGQANSSHSRNAGNNPANKKGNGHERRQKGDGQEKDRAKPQ